MADNVVADPGAGGSTFATDDIAGVHYPRSKLVWGADGTATDASSANPLPTVHTGALPAGTNNIGDVDVLTLPALVAGTANIGDVDVLSVPSPLSTAGGGTEVTALRVTIANNSTGLLSVDDNGGSLTIDGAVTANAGTGTFTVDSELPAAAALADATVNPTTPLAGAALEIFNGTTWDRARGDTTNGIDVDVTRLPALVAGTANIGDVDVLTLPALPAGTNNIGDVDVLTLPALPTGTNSIGRINPEPQTSNGLSISRTLSVASTNATSVKGSAGQVYCIYAHNINAAVRFLKLYNKASAPTVGTDTPVMTLPIPGNTAGAGFVLDTGGMGIAFSLGIGLALTTGIADADTGAVAANDIVVNLLFK